MLVHLYNNWSEVACSESPQDNYIHYFGANGLLDAGLSRYNTPSWYLDSTTKSPYGRTVVNQYLHRISIQQDEDKFQGEYLS